MKVPDITAILAETTFKYYRESGDPGWFFLSGTERILRQLFCAFLVDHYETVYVVDFRYANVNVVDYVKEKNIQDLIIMNNITIIGSDKVASTIAGLL